MNNLASTVLLAVLLLAPQGVWGQQSEAEARLTVAGDVDSPLTLSVEDLRRMPRAEIVVIEEGSSTKYQGVWLRDVLEKAGAPVGDKLRGKALASYVLATARDGYQALFALAELDPLFRDEQVLLADQADGKPLFPYQGPLRLVTRDKRGARSIRMLERIEIVQLRK